MEQVDHPAEGDEGPDEERHVDPERDEVSKGDAFGYDFETAEPQHDDHRRSREERQDGVKETRYPHEAHVTVHVLAVEAVEVARLALLLHVRSHDAHPRQVFLHHGRERGELLLDLFEALVDHSREPQHDRRKNHHRHNRVEREPRADPDHESESEQEAHDRIHRVHDRGPGRHAHGQCVVCSASHEITGPHRTVEAGVEPKEVSKEVVPQVAFDAAAETVEKLAHAVLGGAPEDCRRYDEERIGRNTTHRHIRIGQPVDGQLDQVWPDHREEIGDDDQHQTRDGSFEVGPEVRDNGTEFLQAGPRGSGHQPAAVPLPRGSDAASSVPSGITMMA